MIFLEHYKKEVANENGIVYILSIRLVKHKGIYGFICSYGNDNVCIELNVTDNIRYAYHIFNLLCRENVMPVHLLSVLDDIDFEGIENLKASI